MKSATMPQIVRNVRHEDHAGTLRFGRTKPPVATGARKFRDMIKQAKALAGPTVCNGDTVDALRVRMARAADRHRASHDAGAAASSPSTSLTCGYMRDEQGRRLRPMATADLQRFADEYYGRRR